MKLETTKYEKLFSTPVLRFHVAGHESLNTALLQEGHDMRGVSEGVSKSNRAGWHSEGNLFKRTTPCVQTLKNLVTECIASANGQIGAKADFDALSLKLFAWMNMNPAGGYNAPHTHPGAQWSGVYYVSQPAVDVGNAGMIEFLDPRSDLPNWRILKAPAFRLKKKLRPMPGDMILFPSYLVHWVYPNESDEERVSIAFNATFKTRRKS